MKNFIPIAVLFSCSLFPACTGTTEHNTEMQTLAAISGQNLSLGFAAPEHLATAGPNARKHIPICGATATQLRNHLENITTDSDAALNAEIELLLRNLYLADPGAARDTAFIPGLFPGIPELKKLEMKLFTSEVLTHCTELCNDCGARYSQMPLRYETRLVKDSAMYYRLSVSAFLSVPATSVRIRNREGEITDLSATTFRAAKDIYPLHNTVLYPLKGSRKQIVKDIELVLHDPLSNSETVLKSKAKYEH